MTSSHEAADRSDNRVGLGEVWQWVAPWLLGAVLSAVALLGFFTASRAADEGSYVIGFVTAGLALLMLAWRIRLAGRGAAVPLPLLVEDPAALLLLVAALAVLAIIGLLLAARGGDPVVAAVGYALFGSSLLFTCWNLKHYFDSREHRTRH